MDTPLILNPNLDIDKLRNTYKNDNMIVIQDFLTTESATSMEQSLKNINENAWMVSMHPYQSNMYTFYQNEQNLKFIEEGKISAQNGLANGEFSYLFCRNEGNHVQDFIQFIKSENTIKLLSQIVQMDLKDPISIFASKYGPGCFLTTHTDTGRGTIAFVYNLTRDWRPQYGGCFQIVTWDYKKVEKTIVPEFNTFVMFNVEGSGIPHQVTPVIPNAKFSRIAISGWLNKEQ